MKATITCAILLFVLQQRTPLPDDKPTVLQVSSSHAIQIPAFNYFGSAQCDTEGDLFFHTDSGSFRRATVFELSHNVEHSVMYKLTPELDRSNSFLGFTIRPDGYVYVLTNDDKHLVVFAFDSDGTVSDRVTLDAPGKVIANRFAVFANGTILLDGHYSQAESKELRGKAFAGLFDASGKLTKRFNDEVGQSVEFPKDVSSAVLQEGDIVMGDDGNAYLLRAKEVIVLSPSGTIVRRVKFSKPEPETTATGIFVSEGLLAIKLSKVDKQKQVATTDLVLDATTGLRVGYYSAPEQVNSSIVCFSRSDGFTFLRGDNLNQLTLYTARLR